MYEFFFVYKIDIIIPCLRGMGIKLSQVLISIGSCVACLGIQRKSGGNSHILYVIFHYHCGLILWRFWKVSVINTEILYILPKDTKTVLRWDKEFWREGGAASVHQNQCRALYDSRSDKRLMNARWVCKNCVKDFGLSFAQITDKLLYENERKVMNGCQFSCNI
jgi:hypothetical protein